MDVFFYFIGSDRPPTTMRDTKSLPYPQGRLKNSPFLELTLFSVLFFKGMSKKVGKERERKMRWKTKCLTPFHACDLPWTVGHNKSPVTRPSCGQETELCMANPSHRVSGDGKRKKTNNAASEKKKSYGPSVQRRTDG